MTVAASPSLLLPAAGAAAQVRLGLEPRLGVTNLKAPHIGLFASKLGARDNNINLNVSESCSLSEFTLNLNLKLRRLQHNDTLDRLLTSPPAATLALEGSCGKPTQT